MCLIITDGLEILFSPIAATDFINQMTELQHFQKLQKLKSSLCLLPPPPAGEYALFYYVSY
jgi:hypothetical protein